MPGIVGIDPAYNAVVIYAVDSSGALMPNPDNYAQVLAYNADGTLNTTAFTNGTNTWTQTLSYTSGALTGISAWVKS